MQALLFDEPGRFLAALRPLIDRETARCTILNTVLHNHIAAPFSADPPILVAVADRMGAIMAAALQTPPYPLSLVIDPVVTSQIDVATVLAESVLAADPIVEAVCGPIDDVELFSGIWSGTARARRGSTKKLLLHQLGIFHAPVGVPGAAREASAGNAADAELIAGWWFEFALEAHTSPSPSAPDLDVLARREARQARTVLWCVEGRPVAVAGAGAVVDGVVRIGPVYTPPPQRGHRYGSAVTAAAVESAYGRGARAVDLFTDADYPTSNNIYRRLGFERVEVFAEASFTRAG